MSCVHYLWVFASVLLAAHTVKSKQCDWRDDHCLTIAANNIFDVATRGIPGRFEPVDPLYKDRIERDIGALHYVAANVTMTGLRHCKVELMKIRRLGADPKEKLRYVVAEKLRYVYYLHCPELRFNFHYELKGTHKGVELDVAGLGSETIDDSLIILKGKSETYFPETNQKLRIILKEYQAETELRGNYTFENKELIKGEQIELDMAVAYLNKMANLKAKQVKFDTIKYFLELFMQTLNTYLKDVAVEDVLSADYRYPFQ